MMKMRKNSRSALRFIGAEILIQAQKISPKKRKEEKKEKKLEKLAFEITNEDKAKQEKEKKQIPDPPDGFVLDKEKKK